MKSSLLRIYKCFSGYEDFEILFFFFSNFMWVTLFGDFVINNNSLNSTKETGPHLKLHGKSKAKTTKEVKIPKKQC